MLEEKLKEAIVAELKRQAANDPQLLRIESSDGLVVERQDRFGRFGDGDCGRRCRRTVTTFAELPSSKLNQEQRLPPDVFPKMVECRYYDGWTWT